MVTERTGQMAVKHRKTRARAKKIATLGAATATVTALTAGVALFRWQMRQR